MAPELRRALPLHGIDPVRLASTIATRLQRIQKERPATPEALASKLASVIASKLASPQVLASPRLLDRFQQRVASTVLRTAVGMPTETIDASTLTTEGKVSGPSKTKG